MERLETLSRGELQALAKTHGIKANKKNADLIADLSALAAAEQQAPAEEKQADRGRKSVVRKRKSEAPAADHVSEEESVTNGPSAGRGRKSVMRKRKSEAPAVDHVSEDESVTLGPCAGRGRKSVKRKSEAPTSIPVTEDEPVIVDPPAQRGRKSVMRKRKSEVASATDHIAGDDAATVDVVAVDSPIGFARGPVTAAEVAITDYASLTRSQLQAMAKERGLKANAKTADLIKMLQASEPNENECGENTDSGKSVVADAPLALETAPAEGKSPVSVPPEADPKGRASSGQGRKCDARRRRRSSAVAAAAAVGGELEKEDSTDALTGPDIIVDVIAEAAEPTPSKRASTASSRRSSTLPPEEPEAATYQGKTSPSVRRSSTISSCGNDMLPDLGNAGAEAGPSTEPTRRTSRSSAGRTTGGSCSLESLPSISTLSPRSSLHTTGARSSALRASLDTPNSETRRVSAAAKKLDALPENDEPKEQRRKSSLAASAPAHPPAPGAVQNTLISPMSAAMTAAGEAAALAAESAMADDDDYGATVISVIQNGVRTLIHLESPDNAPSSRGDAQRSSAAAACNQAPKPSALERCDDNKSKARLSATRGALPRKVAGAGAAMAMRVNVKSVGGGIAKKPAAEKLKKVMKKGKLPEFTFDTRSIFVNRNAAAAAAKPASSASTTHTTKLANKENTLAAAPKPSHAACKTHPARRPLSAAVASAARAAIPSAAAAGRRQSLRTAGGGGGAAAKGRGGGGGDLPKGAVATSYAVAQAQGSGRQRKSSEEVFLPAGLPCFVT